MKVIHLNSTDIKGGAARATYRFHKALKSKGVNSKLLVQKKLSDDVTVRDICKTRTKKSLKKIYNFVNKFSLKFYKNRKGIPFSTEKFGFVSLNNEFIRNTDIINLHWINGGFIGFNGLRKLKKLNKPIVWTLHDMWAFTGGCHYSNGCDKYINKCGKCPILKSSQNNDLSKKIWYKKKEIFQKLNLTVVTCSNWLAECAQKSSLFENMKIKVIHNTLDTKIFKPINKNTARNILNLPEDKFLVLFGAINATANSRKGFSYLAKALNELKKSNNELSNKIELLVFGASHSDDIEDLPFNVQFMGTLRDNYTLALCYSAADVFVGPSLEEAFGQTFSEAMACGTPSIAFNYSGPKDIIDHKKTGYLAKYKSVGDLAKGIKWILDDTSRLKRLSNNARKKIVTDFSFKAIGKEYSKLYQNLL